MLAPLGQPCVSGHLKNTNQYRSRLPWAAHWGRGNIRGTPQKTLQEISFLSALLGKSLASDPVSPGLDPGPTTY